MANMRIVGIDEVGRGCLAGPLVAAAVLLHSPVEGLKDSKQLSRRQRINLAEKIRGCAEIGVGWVSAEAIDKIGLTKATAVAMQGAVSQIGSSYDQVIIDGLINYLPGRKDVLTMAKADRLVPTVSAASIIAKVARDQFMYAAAKTFPAYQFEKHVGYGTALHLQLLHEFGICALHRKSFKPIQALL